MQNPPQEKCVHKKKSLGYFVSLTKYVKLTKLNERENMIFEEGPCQHQRERTDIELGALETKIRGWRKVASILQGLCTLFSRFSSAQQEQRQWLAVLLVIKISLWLVGANFNSLSNSSVN